MDLQLQRLRKEAGYKNRDDFAKEIGVKPSTYKTWESGTRKFSFEQACMIADFLKCSLDELAGRYDYIGAYSDERQRDLNNNYESLSDEGKDAALGSVRGIRASESARAKTEGPATGNQKVG